MLALNPKLTVKPRDHFTTYAPVKSGNVLSFTPSPQYYNSFVLYQGRGASHSIIHIDNEGNSTAFSPHKNLPLSQTTNMNCMSKKLEILFQSYGVLQYRYLCKLHGEYSRHCELTFFSLDEYFVIPVLNNTTPSMLKANKKV